MKRGTRKVGFSWPAVLALCLLPVIAALACVCLGRYTIPVRDVFSALGHKMLGLSGEASKSEAIVWSMRLPRVLLSLLVGGGLAVAGAAFQSLFSNPLATPDTLGVASGASLGAALGLLWGLPLFFVQVLALICGFFAVALTFLVGYRRDGSQGMTAIVLAGMVISSLFSAFVSLVKFVADSDSQLPAITYWLMGSLSSIKPRDVLFLVLPVALGLVPLLVLSWRMNLLTLGDEEARSMGVNTRLLRLAVIVCATLLTAASVAVSGMIGWIGLVIPHFCRMLFGYDYRRLLPAAALFGAAFLVVVDDIARLAYTGELPLGILTAFVGAPIFLYLLLTGGGRRGN